MSGNKIDETKYYVLYDGDCGFCNHWVQWILKNDKKNQFMFAALQSKFGQQFLWQRGLDRNQFNTLYLWKPKSFYLIKSEAVSRIAKIIGGKYGVMASLNVFPRFLSDKIYDKIAENRLKLSAQNCFLPSEEEKKKFIE